MKYKMALSLKFLEQKIDFKKFHFESYTINEDCINNELTKF